MTSHASDNHLFTMLHISDLHNKNPLGFIKQVGADINILTGDITDNGGAIEYKKMKAWSEWNDMLGAETILLPGNHDFCKAGNIYDERCVKRWRDVTGGCGVERDLNKRIEHYSFVLGMKETGHARIHVLALNSVAMTNSPFDLACGEIGHEQLLELDMMITQIKSHANMAGETSYIIVALHHHPFIHGETTMRLKDSSKLLSVIHGRVDLMLFGHQHIADHWENRWGIPHVLAAPGFADESWGWKVVLNTYTKDVTITPVFEGN